MLNETEKLRILVENFNSLFAETENTLIQPGAEEPFYRTSRAGQKAIIFSRESYFSSALHEIAHWCIAGTARRELDDFGYWYCPEGRNQQQQQDFELVEVKPQAIEWALSLACDHKFHFSADNLSQEVDASEFFKDAVYRQLVTYLDNTTLPGRAALLFDKLVQVFRDSQPVELPCV